jgi:hypothetical protein
VPDQGFLPPQPPGPEPELGSGAGQPPQAWQPPPPRYAQPWVYAPRQPDNGPAVAGFVCSIVAAGLLLMTVFFSSIVSVVLAAVGIHFSRKGRQKVRRGETMKHQGLAQAGFVTGIVTLVIASLATLLIVLFIVVYATDESFRHDFNNDPGNGSGGIRSALTVLALAGRIAGLAGGI